ncbi:MAG TPA: hypothetical protein VF435_19355 [Pyrinomonadaceae bacterium]
MITDCFGGSSQFYYFEENDFFSVVGNLMMAVVPAATGYALWRIFVTNRTGPVGTTILGLDQNSETYQEAYDHGMSWRTMFLYGVTGVVFGFEVFRYLVDLLLA